MVRTRRPRRRLIAVVAALATVTILAVPGQVHAATTKTYVVLYRSTSVSSDAAKVIEQAGGTLVHTYHQIGVAIASSPSPSFRVTCRRPTSRRERRGDRGLRDPLGAPTPGAPEGGDLPNAPATDSDSLSGLQWDMGQIHAPEAHAITGGSPTVLVGDIDTGLDYTHPDLAPNVDAAQQRQLRQRRSRSGHARREDDNGHGTHTAGTIAAASNGIGIVGVAPNVKIAGIKAGNADGFFFPEAVVCAFMWAGTHGIDVTNNSYFADPWLFNCKNDPTSGRSGRRSSGRSSSPRRTA